MKKRKITALALITLMSFNSCGDKTGAEDDAANEKQHEMYSENEDFYNFSTLVTDDAMLDVYKTEHKSMFNQGEYDAAFPIIQQFRFLDTKTNYAYAELIFTKGEQKEISFILYTSDDQGQFDPSNYEIIADSRAPCLNCKMEWLTLVSIEGSEKTNVKGTFVDLETNEKIKKYMKFDPETKSLKWGPKFWTK